MIHENQASYDFLTDIAEVVKQSDPRHISQQRQDAVKLDITGLLHHKYYAFVAEK